MSFYPTGVTIGDIGRVEVADMNSDGIADLITDGMILFGAGDGTFPKLATFGPLQAVVATEDFAVGDFNGDGIPDLVTVEELVSSTAKNSYVLQVRFGNGDGTFTPGPVTPLLDADQFLITTGDFNGDGRLDLLVQSYSVNAEPFGGPSPTSSGSVYFGGGDGTFKYSAVIQGLPFSFAIGANVSGDQKSDLLQTTYTTHIDGVVLSLSKGDGTFVSPETLAPKSDAIVQSVAVADFNLDGRPDVAIAYDDGNVAILLNTAPPRLISVSNAASGTTPIAPGSLVSIYGGAIDSTNVTINGVAAPILYHSAKQINVQAPWEITGSSATVAVTSNSGAPLSFTVPIASIAPGIFMAAPGQALATHLNGIPISPASPASPGEIIILYANGLGPVSPAIATGANSLDMTRQTGVTPVFIGGVQASVLFSGLAPSFVGVNQLNVVVPNVASGNQPIVINAGGIITSDKVTIAIR